MSATNAMATVTYYDCQNGKGVIMPTTEAVKGDVEKKFKDIFGPDVDLTEETPVGRMVEWLTFLLSQFPRITAQNANQTNINYATGVYLDGIGSLFRKTRRTSQQTQIAVKLTGVADTTIPAGSRMTDVNGNAFTLAANEKLDGSGLGDGVAVSVKNEDVSVAAGDLNHIDDAVVGWYSVTNESSSALVRGSTGESDAEYRARIANGRYSGVGYLEAMRSAIEAVPDVSDVFVIENDSSTPQVVEGIYMDGHSVFICVEGATVDIERIAEAIFRTKSAGCAYTRLENKEKEASDSTDSSEKKGVSVFDVFGIRHRVYFYYPSIVNVSVRVKVNIKNYTGDNYDSEVKAAVERWFDNQNAAGSKIGIDIYSTDIALAIGEDLPTLWIRDVEVKRGGTNDTEYGSYVDISGCEKAQLATSHGVKDITVELV